jgi:hypothetical protein
MPKPEGTRWRRTGGSIRFSCGEASQVLGGREDPTAKCVVLRMKPQMTMEPKPRIAHIVQIGVLQRRLAVVKAPIGRKVIQTKLAHLTAALGRWVEDGQILSQQVRDGFEAEGVDLGTLDARLVRLLRDKNERKPACPARGK